MKPQIFISYRREGGEFPAKMISDELTKRGYTTFFDHETLANGNFEEAIRESIQACTDFILVVSKGAFDRCNNDQDFVRLEIREALTQNKNIIPVFVDNAFFPSYLPYDIDQVRKQNGVRIEVDQYNACMDKLARFLKSRSSGSTRYTLAPKKKKTSKKGLIITLSILAALGIAAGILFFTSLGQQLLCSHDYATSVVSPTCTEGGYTLKKCNKCDKTNKSDLVNPYGHSFGKTVYEVTPTCTAGGRGNRTCVVCDHSETKTLPAAGHTFEAWVYDSEATATENGLRHRSCTVCEHYEEEILYATGSEGLAFTLVGSTYTVSGIGSCAEENIIIPPNVEGTPVTAIAKNAFKDCALITSVTIPDTVTVIGKNAFKDCTSLAEVKLPTRMNEIGEYAFSGCLSLTSITIPAGITEIPTRMLSDCVSLTTVSLPKSITKLGAYSLNGCRSLESIHYESTKVLWRNNVSLGGGCYQSTGKFTIYCSDGEITKMDWEGVFGG